MKNLIHSATYWHTTSDGSPFGGSDTTLRKALSVIRISFGSGSVTVDAQGLSNARQATLFFFAGISKVNGELTDCPLTIGDSLYHGDSEAVTPPAKAWKVTGINPVYSGDKLHHWEVSCA